MRDEHEHQPDRQPEQSRPVQLDDHRRHLGCPSPETSSGVSPARRRSPRRRPDDGGQKDDDPAFGGEDLAPGAGAIPRAVRMTAS